MTQPNAFTDRYLASCDAHDLEILVEPSTDFDSSFVAFDTDESELIQINGWLWTFERI
ncbi:MULTISPECIES: hypothetical protein [Sphingomonas]|uniref:hypothetical protein n=1 Tax=Sphingomonas TaxID=13687 RepID=UPI0013B4087B|nr:MULTISPECIES: hypothetical protein [Sphingomonas]